MGTPPENVVWVLRRAARSGAAFWWCVLVVRWLRGGRIGPKKKVGITGGPGRRPTGLSRRSRLAVVRGGRVRLEVGGWLRLKSHPDTRPGDLFRESADHSP